MKRIQSSVVLLAFLGALVPAWVPVGASEPTSDAPKTDAEWKATPRKTEDTVTLDVQPDQVLCTITCPSGIGGTTLTPPGEWPKKMILRLRLRGLESLTLSHDEVSLHAAVLSHGDYLRMLRVVESDVETGSGEKPAGKPIERTIGKDDPYWAEIRVFDANGKATTGLPGQGGYFEIELPAALFQEKPRSLSIAWIDFYRG